MISIMDDFNNKNIKILSIDFETRHVAKYDRIRNQIFAAGFFSNKGFNEAVHPEDDKFRGDEVKFISLVVLNEVCKCMGVTLPVGFYEVPTSQLEEDYDVDNE
jgi:hypothetical protein